jgi:hypothetical protein
MAIVIDGTNGVSGVDGSAGTPAVQGSDTNTGVFFPAADTAAIATGGSERMRIDSTGSLRINNTGSGGTGPNATGKFLLNSDGYIMSMGGRFICGDNASTYFTIGNWGDSSSEMRISTRGFTSFVTGASYEANGTERMRIDSSGNLLVGTTSTIGGSGGVFQVKGAASTTAAVIGIGTDGQNGIRFMNSAGSQAGTIVVNTSSTSYNSGSDYRLKEDIQPMTGALAKVAALKPVTYKWKVDGSDGEGFIAHELAEVVPQCVTGEKDAVDAEGNPQYQGIDTSFLVATLTAAIQEQQAIIEQLKADVAALK